MTIKISVWFVVVCIALIFLLFHNGIKRFRKERDMNDEFITGFASFVFSIGISVWLIWLGTWALIVG